MIRLQHTVKLVVWVVAALLGCVAAAAAQEPEPETRAEALRRQREAKATELVPPQPTKLEKALLDLENGRVFERLLSPPEGLYPKFGTITPGSGLSIGPGYRSTHHLGGNVDFSTFAMASLKGYWIGEARVQMPRLLDERLAIDLHGQRYDFAEEPFFGIGPDSLRSDEVFYGLRNFVVGGSATLRPRSWLSISGGADYLTPRIEAFGEDDSIGTRFDETSAPGLTEEADFVRSEGKIDVNFREPRGNPRQGGRYTLTYQRFEDIDSGSFSFNRVEADAQQYISLYRNRRILALRALASVSDNDEGARVPFYFQRTLGGPDDLRGFRRFRFRDENALLFQAEYRWEIFTAVDGALFYDAGKVASRIEDVNLQHLESDYGFGFRFGTANNVFLRIEAAFGSSGGKHFIFRFANVF
jgi:surface antigen Omp85-like protein